MNVDRMPLNGESPSTESRQEFCRALKAARERKGITLAEIAAATKVPASAFAALERGDLRRWPRGLFRRSFFRDYARTIGLPVAELCDEFVRLFPDETSVSPKAGLATEAAPADDVRLVFDATWHGPHAPVLGRLLAALLDAGVVLLTAAALAWFERVTFAAGIAFVALTYFSLATALLGESPAQWIKTRRRSILDALTKGTSAATTASQRTGDVFSSVFGRSDGGAADNAEEPAGTWMSDAHRVEPALSARLRVRIKTFQ